MMKNELYYRDFCVRGGDTVSTTALSDAFDEIDRLRGELGRANAALEARAGLSQLRDENAQLRNALFRMVEDVNAENAQLRNALFRMVEDVNHHFTNAGFTLDDMDI